MANSSGFFPGVLRPLQLAGTGGRWRAALLWPLLMAVAVGAETPNYLPTALAKFTAEVPPQWAYTLTTEREGQQTIERFDPTKPPTEQWTLLRTENRTPTPDDIKKYFKYKAGQAPGAMQATFQKTDIETGSMKLVWEDSARAEFACSFREQSTYSDKMLGHLRLRLTVSKRNPHVEKSTLELQAPYSPVLGVKMRELAVEMNFSPPEGDRPSLLQTSSSHFLGRIFFVPVEENLRYTYSDFVRLP